jgi:predicted transcriptional regulator
MTQKERQTAYDAWFVDEVDAGLIDLDAGRVMTNAEATEHMERLFAELACTGQSTR